jgi:hypothetical protein
MGIQFNVTRKFKINGQEYDSVAEMPPEVRKTFEKALSRVGSVRRIKVGSIETNLTFTGTRNNTADAMPQNVRQLHGSAENASENLASSTADSGKLSSGDGHERSAIQTPPSGSHSIQFKFSFSPRRLAVSVAITALLCLLYYLWRNH